MERIRTQDIKKKYIYWCKNKKAFVEKKNIEIEYNALPHKKPKKSNEEEGSKKECKKN